MNHLPGSKGEHLLQNKYGTSRRALAFYDNQMLSYLNPAMKSFIAEQEIMFISTSDSKGECDSSFRFGSKGFVHVINEKTIVYPEYRGNGVMASLGNISENPHIGILLMDFYRHAIGLHVNGKAAIVEEENLTAEEQQIIEQAMSKEPLSLNQKTPGVWVRITVEEAYIHCSKHIPLLRKLDKEIAWGTDSEIHKGGDFFKIKS